MLASGNVKDNMAFSYKYDPNNLRYSKTVSGVETLYYWDDDVLVGERTGDNFIQYIYDANGIAGMKYNDSYYYFEKNLFGDVLKVYGVYGNVVAEFKYDSYGNIISNSGSFANNVKFRYRGYYYDDETGFYYLQTRYYDPSLCRFISADQFELLPSLSQILGELNFYSYCCNNPIMHYDKTGESVITTLAIIFGIAGAIAGGAYMGIKAYNSGYDGWELIGISTIGAILGGIAGVAFGVGLGNLALGIGPFVKSSFFISNLVNISYELASISVSKTLVVAGATTAALGISIVLSKGSGPRFGHNQHENQMFEEALRRKGITDKNLRQRIHYNLKKYPYQDTLKGLIEIIEKIIRGFSK